ncbi:VCBS domain-containing protein [Vibrio breoganii]|uniref:VCBS domain-containing protein n=1 Tax=Vibrio breoganii TaxID=553239 RepID=UPI0039A75F84
MSDKSKQNKDSKSVIKNTDTKAVQKDLSAKADASKRAVKKERETKKKQIYIPLGLTLSLVLPSFRKADATETDTSSAIAPLESHSKISAPTVHHATETEHSASATSLVQQNIITTADEKDSNSIHSQAHSSNYSHHPVISHPFMNVGYEVANTHASELQGYQTASPQQPTESTVTYREETLTGKYGTLTVGPDGHYAYNLNPKSPAFILLQGHELGTDSFVIHLSNGLQQTVAVPITGNNEAAQFSGDLAGAVTEDLNVNSNGLITTQGTLAVSDQDHDQDSLVAVHNQATKYGEFSIDESGHWQYQVNNAGNTVQALSSGQMLQETITVHSVDGTEQQIVVTINGQDDTAVISGNDLGSVVEDKQPQVSGKLDVTDPDASQQHFQGGDLVGTLGTLHLQDNGAWTYDLDNTNPKVQALGQAATATDTITVQSADGTTHKVTITVNGTNDKAVIAGTDSGAVTEESQLQTSGTLTVTDVDTGEAHFSNTDVVGTLGTLHLKDNGAWSYDLDNTNPTVQALGQGKTATDTITVQSADGTTHKVTITVNGINDKAVIAGTDSGAVTEESQLQTSGTLTVTDVDTGEAHFSNTDIAGTLGTLHLTDSGAWTYDLDNTNPTVQALSKGATATDTITVQSADGTTHKVTITVNGTNDKAVIAGTDSGAVTEESQLQTSGTLTVTDVDTGEAHFSNTDVVGTLGTLHLKDNGAWSYDLDNTNPTVQALGQGKTATDTITVQSADGTTHKVTITVNGTNDKAVIAGTDSGAVTEESQLQASGTLTVTDVDTGEAHFSNTDIAGNLGTLHLTDSGAWTYDLDNTNPTVQALGKGATATDTITVHSTDGTPHQVKITINGTNDKAVIAGTDSGAVTEESQLQTSGTLTATDVDTGEAHFSNTDVVGTLGTLHLKDNGAWTYDLDNTNPKVQALGNGATATDTLTVHSADGTPHQVKITVNGTNDKAVIAGSDSGAVTEESQLQTSGTLTVTDVDTGEAHFSNTDIAGTLGTLHLKDNGAWTYNLDNTNSKVQALGKGATATDIITVQSADGTTHKVTITVNGTNDTAVIGGTNSGAVTEESQLQTSGTLTVTDVDTGEAHFSNTDIAGNLGTLHLTDSGAWTYDLDNTNPTVQALGKGATATDTITVHSADGTPHQVTITVNGTNDAAVIMGTSTGDVHEGHTFTAPDGSMTGGYVDDRSPDHMHGNIGKLWNDEIHTDGHLSIVDADAGESYAQTGVYYGSHGRVILQTNGDWSYFASIGQDATGRAIDHLGKGESLTDTVTVKSADGTTHDIVITIHGDNDRPYCSGEVQLNSGKEDLAQTITATELIANTVDVDANDAGKLTIANLHADHGSIQDNHDGTFTFTPSHNYNGSVHFTYDVKDAHGGTTHTGASTTLSAVGDKAQIAGVDTGSITENSAGVDMSPDYAHSGIATLGNTTLYADGKLTITDPDVGESGFERQGSNGYDYHGTYGDLILLTDGTWHYHADAGHLSGIGARPTTRGTAIDQLGEGQSLTDTITVHSKDGTTHDIVITIHGSNDRPYCSSEVVLANGSEDTRQTLTTAQLLANTVDVDANDAGKLTIENLHADHGSILNNADGTFTFTPEKDYNGAVHFSYDVKDAHGGVTHTGATTNLAAVNDNPDVTPLTDSVSEGADNHHTLNLLVGATDKDGDALSVSHLEYAIDGQLQAGKIPAGITLDTNGHTLIVDATDPAFNHLANGQSQQIAITYQVEDGHGGSTQQTATLTIAGTDDKATLVSNVIQLTETQALDSEFKSYRGQLQLIDPDSGDNTQFVFSGKYLGQGFEPGHLDVWPNGTYQFRLDAGTNRHADDLIGSLHAGESMELPYEVETTDGQKLTIMVKVTGEDNQAKIAVTPYSSLNNHVYEDHTSFGNTTNQLSSGGTLQVIDPDHDQAGFIAQTITTAEGGRFNINAQGHWSYDIDNDKVQRLGAGESFQQTFTVESIDGSAKKDITVTVHGTNDAPVASSEVRLANGLEDNKIVLTPAQLLANTSDVDDNDIGKLSIENLQADHGAIALNADGTFTFTPEKDYNGDVHFSYDVKDAHGGVTHTGASTTLSAVADKAQIAGVDTGSITENSAGVDMSPDYAHSGIATLGNTTLYADGKLTITDPDVGESGFERQGSNGYDYHGTYGDLILLTDGTWHYHADAGHLSGIGARPTTHGTVIDQLGEGQSLTDTITVHSKDGTTHDIVITIHGSNDRPYCSSEVVLANGSEDTRQNLTTTQLLANTVDVDKNDAGKLTIENLHADHGSILNNADGTFIFTPEKDYNGDVHFSYDVKDAHGGVTHTGASTSLAAVDDKTIINGVDHGVATEDVATHMSTNVNIMDAVDWQALQITDVDSSNQQVTVEFAGKQYTWDLGSNLDVTTPYGKFQFYTITNGPHTGEHCWSYIGDNSNVHVQELKHGESFTESIKLIATDGTEFPITVKVNGSEDGVVIDSKSELGHVVENAQTGASVSGSAIAHDVDLHDTVSWTQTPTTGLNGQYGTFHLSADGQWHYDVDQSKATKLGDGDEYWEHFTVEAVSTDGSHVSKSVSVVVHGNNDVPTVSGEVSLPSGKEDTSIHITQAELIANATDVDTNDRGWLHVENLTADHGNLVSNSDGSFTFNPDPNYNGTVHFTYDVADRHGGIAHTGANTTLAAVNDVATFTGDSGSIGEDTNLQHNIHISGQPTVPDALVCQGHLVISDVDGQGEAALDLKGQSLVSQDGTYGHFIVKPNGSWLYTADNNSVPIQDLDNGQTLTDSIEITSKDGTKHSITVTINGTTDAPSLHSLTDSGIQNSGPIEGNLITGLGTHEGLSGAATDTDSNAHLVLQDIQIKDPVSGYVAVKPGQPHTMMGIGTLAIEANGHYTFTPEAGFSGKVPNMVYRVGDEGGNPIGDSSQNSLSIEVTPRQPNTVSLALATGSDSGSKGDLITNDNTPSVEGHTLIPNSSVDIVENGKVIGTTVSDGNGDYHLNLPGLTDATHTLQAVATDPLSSTQVHSHPLAVVIDTVATISVNPISQDNMLTGSEHTHSFDISGSVLGVEDGQTIEVEIDHHTYQGQVSSGKWSIAVPASVASSLTGGVHQVAVSATDKAGNHAAMHSPLFVVDGSSTPPLPTIQTPHITGGGGVGSHVTGVLIAPPLLQQLHPQVGSGWGILDPHGHIVTHLQGQYGTLVIDPQTGHVDYQYSSAPTAGQKVQGGTHWAGQTSSEQHHDVFQIMYHDTHSSNVDVKVNLDVTYIHGHSGHNQTSTHLVGMSVTPVTPTVQHDEPAPEPEVIEVTLYADDDNTHHDLMAGLSALADDHSSSGSNPYTDIVGLHDAPQTGDSAMPTPEPAPDLDLLLNQGDELAHQHPVDAFIDNNGEEHKADEQHVLDEEHIEHDLPDVMDLPDHHH